MKSLASRRSISRVWSKLLLDKTADMEIFLQNDHHQEHPHISFSVESSSLPVPVWLLMSLVPTANDFESWEDIEAGLGTNNVRVGNNVKETGSVFQSPSSIVRESPKTH